MFTLHHYDFQLRTALATVSESVSLKGSSTEENEIVGRAIRHVISPYIVNSDRNTFERIISTTIQAPKSETEDDVTKKVITQTIEEMGLVANEKFVDACFSVGFCVNLMAIFWFLAISFVKTKAGFYFTGSNAIRQEHNDESCQASSSFVCVNQLSSIPF
jgi:hypothetical protein